MQHMNRIRWLKDAVEVLGDTISLVQTKVVCEPHFKNIHISFHVPVRHIDFISMPSGEAIPMVSIATMGVVAPI